LYHPVELRRLGYEETFAGNYTLAVGWSKRRASEEERGLTCILDATPRQTQIQVCAMLAHLDDGHQIEAPAALFLHSNTRICL
jgi:hypothetical protein